MESNFFYLPIRQQEELFFKLEDLWKEIDEAKDSRDGTDLGKAIANNIEFAKAEIKQTENILMKTVHRTELNHALGINII